MKESAIIKPRYSKGSGLPPVHLSWVSSEDSVTGDLVFAHPVSGEHRVPCASRAELLDMFNTLVLKRVALAVGGMLPGPADEIAMLIAGPYVELSWSGPQQWTLRETINGASEWQPVPEADGIANVSFDPESLRRTD